MALMHRPGMVRRLLTVGAAALAVVRVASVGAVDQDGAFMSARDAFQKGQIERLNQLAGSLTAYPLYPYVAAWQLRSRLAELSPEEVQRFLAAQGDSLAGQRLRGDWLKQLGQKRAWELFEREYPAFALDDVEVGCYALQARLARSDLTALQEARPLWFQGAAQPESCGPLFDALVTRGQITEEDVWVRVRLALEAGNVSFVKALMPYLPPAKRIAGSQLDSAARNPQRYLERRPLALKTQGDREVAMFATWRIAQTLPAVAASRLEKYDTLMPAADRGYVWAQVATAGALKHRSEALDWFKRTGDVTLSDRQLGWKTRIGLRAGDWQQCVGSHRGHERSGSAAHAVALLESPCPAGVGQHRRGQYAAGAPVGRAQFLWSARARGIGSRPGRSPLQLSTQRRRGRSGRAHARAAARDQVLPAWPALRGGAGMALDHPHV